MYAIEIYKSYVIISVLQNHYPKLLWTDPKHAFIELWIRPFTSVPQHAS